MHECENPLLRLEGQLVYNGQTKISGELLVQLSKIKVLLSSREGQLQN
jgi:hypothetical protein